MLTDTVVTWAQRTRFAVEIIQAMRARVPDDFPIVFRFSQWKSGDYHHKMAGDPEELESFLLPLSDAGVDIFHCSTRRFNDPEFEGSNLNLAGLDQTTDRQTIDHGWQRRLGQ